jgi:hypothetical protein
MPPDGALVFLNLESFPSGWICALRIGDWNTTGATLSNKRPVTPGYIFFFTLFLPDTWQIIAGVLAAHFLAPAVVSEQMGLPARILLHIMIATIGYAASRAPARGFTRLLKKWIVGDKTG